MDNSAVLKRLRIAILLYILLFVAVGEFLTARFSKDWDVPLWVHVYPLGDDSSVVRDYLDKLPASEFKAIEEFFDTEARRYGVTLERPFRLAIAPRLTATIPELSARPGMLETLWWSLRMRWLVTTIEWRNPAPRADIVVFAVFHEPAEGVALDRSIGLEKGLIATAHLFAAAAAHGSNHVVLAHELLHTLGASDKYDPATNLPLHPIGFAEPQARPLFPQRSAELMAGRIALSHSAAVIPAGLRDVVVGPATALEIGWLRQP